MHSSIIKDLSKTKGADVFRLLADFNKNAQWAGYFFGGMDDIMLRQMQTHEQLPKHGFHITIWHKANNALNIQDFMRIVCDTARPEVNVLGYADDGKNQALAVSRPPLYISPAQPHVTISWDAKANAAASGYLQFGEKPANCPDILHNGHMKVIMHNNREMVFTVYRQELVKLMMLRAQELSAKMNPHVKDVLDKIYLDKVLGEKPIDEMTIGEIKAKFVNTGIEFNETIATLYARYVTSAIDLHTKSRSDIEKEEDLEEAKYDKITDEQHEADNQDQ